MENDEVPTSTPSRILEKIAPNEMVRIDTTEGESLEFRCKGDATATNDQNAAGATWIAEKLDLMFCKLVASHGIGTKP